MHDPTPLWELLDQALAWFAEPEREPILRSAQDAFMHRTGAYEATDPWFEERVRLFHDAFLFDHQIGDRVALAAFLAERGPGIAAGQRALYADLLRTGHRSLFEVRSRTDAAIVLRDCLGGPTYPVAFERELAGLAPFDLLDLRLLRTGGVLFPARGLLVHPRPAREAILSLVERRAEEDEAGLWDLPDVLAHMKLAHDRAENPRVAATYHPDSYLFRRRRAPGAEETP
jgi:hypothetical protein